MRISLLNGLSESAFLKVLKMYTEYMHKKESDKTKGDFENK